MVLEDQVGRLLFHNSRHLRNLLPSFPHFQHGEAGHRLRNGQVPHQAKHRELHHHLSGRVLLQTEDLDGHLPYGVTRTSHVGENACDSHGRHLSLGVGERIYF